MDRVIVESPYAGDVSRNVDYARLAIRDALYRGYAPFASHLLYTQPGILDDGVPEQRHLGIDAGFAWGLVADRTLVYVDLGVSAGMHTGIVHARSYGRPIDYYAFLNGPDAAAVCLSEFDPRRYTEWRAHLDTTHPDAVAVRGLHVRDVWQR